MKNIFKYTILAIFFIISLSINLNVEAYNNGNTKESFINSPSANEISLIENRIQRVCEQVFLEVFMRREFSELENRLCSDVFERKIEAQLNYMRYVMLERGIY